jgi:glycolate oxidase subunit GlcD
VTRPGALERDLRALLGADAVLPGSTPGYCADQTEGMGVRGHADAIVLPADTGQVAATVDWCYSRDVAIVPRGGGSGFAGGAVPVDGGVVLGLDRMTAVRAFAPLLWRIHVEAGVRTATIQRLAREHGLVFPPDPGAAEQSQIGGNVATNAGGPHAFKYGVTGAWVTGLEAVVPPGEVVTVGGPIRKDVAGYDLKHLLIGSEGTLGVVTSVWLRLMPAPEAALPVVGCYPAAGAGCAAIECVLGSGLVPAALEFLDARALAAAGASYPRELPPAAQFMVIAEADGSSRAAHDLRDQLVSALSQGASAVHTFDSRAAAALWRWRDGVSIAVTAQRGGKVSEDIVVPLERLHEAIEETIAIGRRHALEACSWGHAGDGNLHSTFLFDPGDAAEQERARGAAGDLFELAVRLGGSVSGEHGIGWAKRGQLSRQWDEPALRLHDQVKRAFDPKGLLNPGKKVARRAERAERAQR